MGCKKIVFLAVIILLCFLQLGCSLLSLPFQALGLATSLASDAIGLAASSPVPPWMFF
jgi:hypothetical protein